MEDEVVRRRKWLSREEFLDLLGAANLIPGPNSTELAIHIGYRRAGLPGLVVAGVCFIVPAMTLVLGFAWLYTRFGRLPPAAGILRGIKPVIIAVVLQALWGFGKTAVKSLPLGVLGAAALLASFLGVHELAILVVAGALGLGLGRFLPRGPLLVGPLGLGLLGAGAPVGAAAAPLVAPVAKGALFLFFVKVGSVLFGSGYVLIAFLRADLVARWRWLSEAQLLDAVAVGQFTPGPVFTTATFIGYLLGGVPSALLATLGIFLPAFVFVALTAPLVARLRKWQAASLFLDGVNVASLSLMALATWQLGRAAVTGPLTMLLALGSLVLLLRYRVNSAWLVLGGAGLGCFLL